MKKLKTIAKGVLFSYEGSLLEGTTIYYGKDGKNKKIVTTEQYKKLLIELNNINPLTIGAARNNPPKNSLGAWLQINVIKTAIASYVAPILINEKKVELVNNHKIKIL